MNERLDKQTPTTPFRAGQRVRLNSAQRPSDAHVLAIHPSRLGGWEVIVRTLDYPDQPGRTVNVFMTGDRCSMLTLVSNGARAAS
jgi:hypothetical protein